MANNNFDDENSEVMKQNAILLRRNSIQGRVYCDLKILTIPQGLFNGYNYDINSVSTVPSGMLTPQLKQASVSSHNNGGSYAYTSFSNQTTRSISASSPLDQR